MYHSANGLTKYVKKEGMSGWFYRVLQEGIDCTVHPGDTITLIYRQANPLPLRTYV